MSPKVQNRGIYGPKNVHVSNKNLTKKRLKQVTGFIKANMKQNIIVFISPSDHQFYLLVYVHYNVF